MGPKDHFSALAKTDQTIGIPVMSNDHIFISQAFRTNAWPVYNDITAPGTIIK